MREILIISSNIVFIETIKCIISNVTKYELYNITIYNSFSDSKEIIKKDDNDIIIIDDEIIGISSYELMSYLRYINKITSSIIFFGNLEYGGDKKSYAAGANFFINKPFNVSDFENIMKSILTPYNKI